MTKLRVFLALATLALVTLFATGVFLYAKGYRLSEEGLKLTPSGLLVVKSDPDGAQLFINGELETATNANISIAPGTYDVSIRRDGFLSWNKRLTVEKEEVTQVDAVLFPAAPSLTALTFEGVGRTVATPELTKVAYEVPLTQNLFNSEEGSKAGLWVIELLNLPLGFSNEPRQITDANLEDASWIWSPDRRELLLNTAAGVFLIDAGKFTAQDKLVNVTSRRENILLEWQDEKNQKLSAQLNKLPDELQGILERKAASIVFAPDETKVLYTASGEEIIPEELASPLPGASTQRQERDIKNGRTYVYDIKEDRNFLVSETRVSLDTINYLSGKNNQEPQNALRWFPTSSHLVLVEKDRVTIMDYDGTNKQQVYSGNYVLAHAYPFVNRARILILTNLGAESTPTNLYSLSLK